MKKKRIVIAAGGTGGHIFPALSLAHQCKNQEIPHLFIGGKLSSNSFFDNQTFPYCEVSCSRPSFKSPLFPLKIMRGAWQSIGAMRTFKPDLIVAFGSYYTLPVLIAARALKIPYIIHEQNSIPGRVNRLFAKGARLTAIHFPEAAKLLAGKSVEVAMPLRPDFYKRWDRQNAKKAYGFDETKPVLLVFGGSQGAEGINRLFYLSADQLKRFQVLHFTGGEEWKNKLTTRYQENGVKAVVVVFEKEMSKAWGAADLVVSRAGAASIAEQIACEVPGILIPYPYAMDQHQNFNADYLVRIGGAIKLIESEANVDSLLESIDTILSNRNDMQQTIRATKKEQKELLKLLQEEL